MAEKKKKQDKTLKEIREELEELKQQRKFGEKMIKILNEQETKEYIVLDELYNLKQEAAAEKEKAKGRSLVKATKKYCVIDVKYIKAKENFRNTLKRKEIYKKQVDILKDNIELLKEKLPTKSKDAGRTK